MVWFLVVGLLVLIEATAGYVGGRIILPEMGLTAPGWWAWFWLLSWIAVFVAPITLLVAVVD